MTETDARSALLVRAWETAPAGTVAWTDDDRRWASRAAAEVEGEDASADVFIARRGRLAAERLAARDGATARALRVLAWRPWVAWAVAAIAFVLGAFTDAIGSAHRINILAPPLLALMAWNLLVYAAIAAHALVSSWRRLRGDAAPAPTWRRLRRPLSRLLARAAHLTSDPRRIVSDLRAGAHARDSAAQEDGSPLARFAIDWANASARLNATRIARLLHVGAMLFALGALTGMYLRGLVFEYRAGWESTFLDAGNLRAVLDFVLGPASRLTGIALPDTARLEAMRFPASPGERAAPWIHLYAVTVALVVLLPRLVLAAIDATIERRLARMFPIALDDAYFAALTRSHRGEASTVTVVPYNHQPSPRPLATLRALLASAMGPGVVLEDRPPVAYGDEETAGEVIAGNSPPALVVALFAATATPEAETHGDFVEALAESLPPGVPLLVVVDESSFVARFGTDATGNRRRDERRQAWTRVLAAHQRAPLFADLREAAQPSPARVVREALDRAARAAAASAA